MSVLFETTSDMHRIAAQLRQHAAAIRAQATTIAVAADQTRWYSPAADRFRHEVAGLSGQMRTAADRLETAARALDAHARHVHSALSVPSHVAGSVASALGLR